MRLGLVVVGLALCASADADPRAGKVVRIERGSKRPFGTPRQCTVTTNDLTAYCYGKRPEPGEHIAVVDYRHALGVLRVDGADPLGNTCPQTQPLMWIVHVTLESGDLQSNDTQVAGFLDVTVDPRLGHLMKVDRVPGERPINPEQVLAVDTDGDSIPDLQFQLFACDDQNNPSPASAAQCSEVWYGHGHALERIRTDRIPQSCN